MKGDMMYPAVKQTARVLCRYLIISGDKLRSHQLATLFELPRSRVQVALKWLTDKGLVVRKRDESRQSNVEYVYCASTVPRGCPFLNLQCTVLLLLAHEERPVTSSIISKTLSEKNSMIYPALVSLCNQGLIKRTRNEGERYKYTIATSPQVPAILSRPLKGNRFKIQEALMR